MRLRDGLGLLRESGREWSRDNAGQLGAALAYYTVFSLAPLLVIALGIAGMVLDRSAAQQQVVQQLGALLGAEAGAAIDVMIDRASRGDRGLVAGATGLLALLFGASGVFAQLQRAMNVIWDIEPAPSRSTLSRFVRVRLVTFGMTLGIGFLLLVSLLVSAGVAAMDDVLGATPSIAPIAQLVSVLMSLALTTGLFALIFRTLPDARVAWSDVWVGAFATALLFSLGKLAIGLYLGNSAIASVYGAASSLAVLLVWVYYSAQILLFGAEFTQVYARRFGSRIRPEPYARSATGS